MLEFGQTIRATWKIRHPDFKGLPFDAEFYTDENNHLYLNANFNVLSNRELYNFFCDKIDKIFSLVGKTEDNKILTLEDAFLSSNNYLPENWKLSVHANYAFLGEKEESVKNIKVKKITVIFDSDEISVLNKTIGNMEFEIKNNITSISYTFSTNETFENSIDEVINIQYLYSFLVGKMISIKSVIIETEKKETYSALMQFTKINQRTMKIMPIMAITPENFVELYDKWKKNILIDTFPIDLYFTTLSNSKNLYEQFYLDYLIRSFEGMHKNIHPTIRNGRRRDTSDYLKNRLLSITNSAEVQDFINNNFTEQQDEILARIIDFRDLYAHCKHSKKEKEIPVGEYYKYSILMFNIIRVFIAKELLEINDKIIPLADI